MLNMTTLGLLCMAGGSAVHAVSLQFAENQQLSDEPSSSSSPPTKGHRGVTKYIPVPHAAGALVIMGLGCTWSWMARHGASSVGPLPWTCNVAVQTGGWVPVDVCNQETWGQTYRHYGMDSVGTCTPQTPTYVWGWQATSPSSHCRMRQRHADTALATLSDRTVYFVGDSILRHLYHSMCRQMGDVSAGAYNTTGEKHGNFTRRYATLDLEFRWAPYTNDTLVPALQSLFEDEESLPDAIIVGGGAWDQLHRHRNQVDHDVLVDGIRNVAEQMRRLREAGVAVTWVVPTTINTWGLMTEEKRQWLREDDMVNLRTVYKDHGIHDAANFVLEGATFTKDRVSDSYDGVHYPLEVYDAGAQILLNAFDWLLPLSNPDKPKVVYPKRRLGSMAHPGYGLIVLIIIAVTLYSTDAFVGLSWLACWLTGTSDFLSPWSLSHEAWTVWHKGNNLPQQHYNQHQGPSPSIFSRRNPSQKGKGRIGEKTSEDDMEEVVQLVDRGRSSSQ